MRKILLAAAAVMAATPALAQVNAGSGNGGLVGVSIPVQNVDILNNFLNNVQIQALNGVGPINVNVPIGVAANVCNIDANVIAQQRKAGTYQPCEAKNGSQALANAVLDQKLNQKK